MINFKDCFYCVLSERLLLFSVSNYVERLALDTLDFLHEWNLLKDGKIQKYNRCTNDYILKHIEETKAKIEETSKALNMKVYFFDFDKNPEIYSDYIDDLEAFSKKVKTCCKKNLCGGKNIPKLESDLVSSGEYQSLKCLNLGGEQLEKVLKALL